MISPWNTERFEQGAANDDTILTYGPYNSKTFDMVDISCLCIFGVIRVELLNQGDSIG